MSECACGKTLSPKNKSGLCKLCILARSRTDPAINAKRMAGILAYYARPETKDAHRARLANYMANMPEAERDRRREHGRAMYETRLGKPETRAKALATRLKPETRRRQGRSLTRTRLPWCPESLVPLYRELTKSGMLAHEARAALQDMIPGTPEHARREVQNTRDAMRIKHERDKASRY